METIRVKVSDPQQSSLREFLDQIKDDVKKRKDEKFPDYATKLKAPSPAIDRQLRDIFSNAKRNAKARGIEFKIKLDDLIARANASGWRCEVTGIPFSDEKRKGWLRRPYVVSIDRIDSAKGYEAKNIRLVVSAVNLAMNEWGLEIFDRIAREYVKRESQDALQRLADQAQELDMGY